MHNLRNQRVTVMGLGRFGGGISVARWLVGQGARVLVTDKDPAEKLAESVGQLAGLPIEFHLGEHREADFRDTDLVVASPAVPLSSPYLAAAREAGLPISTEMRLFVERCPAGRVLAVTGTKGKSTTTSMLGAMLRTRYSTHIGGNLGGSLLDELPRISAEDVVVLELSSFMLEHLRLARWSPHVAVITMLARDHIEWHGSVEGYIRAKQTVLAFQTPEDFAVLNAGCAESVELAKTARAAVKWFGGDVAARNFELRIPGVHNQINAQGAFTAASCLGLSWEEAQGALSKFEALPHRLELVHEANGVRFYNDSIATIPEAAVAALHSFPAGRVIQIVGGRQKDLPIGAMCEALAGRAKGVICIGEKGPEIAAGIRALPKTSARVAECADLAAAVPLAKLMGAPGDIVLLSTGCKSYDQFVNFEKRGEAFARLVRSSS